MFVERFVDKKGRTGLFSQTRGFALPAVLIISVILLAIGVSLLQLGTATTRSLQDQNWNRLAKSAAQAGVSYAGACLKAGTTSWTTTITPSRDCSGAAISPAKSDYITTASLGTSSTSTWRSTFAIAPPSTGSDGISRSQITGKVELVSGGTPVKFYEYGYNAVMSVTTTITSSSKSALQISTTNSGTDISSCEVASDQLIYCAGDNSRGNFGTGGTTSGATPVLFGTGPSSPTAGKIFTEVSVGTRYACAVTTEQEIYCAGENGSGQLGNGQLGDGTIPTNPRTTPVRFGSGVMRRFVHVSAGVTHTCGVTTRQEIYCAGSNLNGQIGNNGGVGPTSNFPTPQRFNASPSKSFTQVTVGDKHTCAITTEQQVFCAGLNADGQLGRGGTTQSTVAVKFAQSGVASSLTFLQVASGLNSTCAVATNGFIYCSGDNTSYVLGDGNTSSTDRLVPVRSFNTGSAVIGKKFSQIAMSGANHTCALGEDSLMYCAGNGTDYQLGNGVAISQTDPVLFGGTVGPTVGKTYNQLSAGSLYTCGVATDGVVYCVGNNSDGQQGVSAATRISPEASMIVP